MAVLHLLDAEPAARYDGLAYLKVFAGHFIWLAVYSKLFD